MNLDTTWSDILAHMTLRQTLWGVGALLVLCALSSTIWLVTWRLTKRWR